MTVVPPTPEPREPGRPDDGGGGPRPLSGREEHALADLEARVTAEDPLLSARVGLVAPTPLDRMSSRTLNLTIQVLVVLVLAVVILPGAWVGVLLMLTVVAGSAVTAVYAIRRDEPS
ncbi:MAG TPA: DUF3040 domain-containing protein [Actinomycetospora sp.]|nr:DUF3040 domain-containing protein [Actinomycetospora sp.]